MQNINFMQYQSKLVLNLIKKSLYIGYLSDSNLDLLRVGKQENAIVALNVDDATEYWKSIWLKKALADRNDMDQFVHFEKKNEIDQSTFMRNSDLDQGEYMAGDQQEFFWVIFDTSTRPQYYQDVHNILALPEGFVYRYDYRTSQMSPSAVQAATST